MSFPGEAGDLTPAPIADPAARIQAILVQMREMIQQSVSDIEQIAQREVQRHGDDTLEGIAWCDFAANGLHSDVARGARHMLWELAALRGSLSYHGLDSRQL